MGEPGLGDRVYAEQVRQLYRLSRPAYAGTLVNSSILVFALSGVVATTLLGTWLCAIFLVTGARYLLYRAYLGSNPPDGEAHVWAQRFVIGAGAAGLMWGVAGSVLFPVSSLPLQFLVIFLIGGMAIAALVVLAPVPKAFLAFILPTMALVTATVLAQGTPLHYYMGVLMAVFLMVLLGTMPIISAMIRDALRVKFENVTLVEQLSHANRELSGRVVAQQRTEDALRQTSQKLGALIDASPVAIVARDQHLRIAKWNRAAERLFGWSEREVLGRTVPFVPPELEGEARVLREQMLRGEPVIDHETVRMRRDGTRIEVSIYTTVVPDAAGQPAGYFSLFIDIAGRKRTERRVQMEHSVTRILAESRSVEDAMPEILRVMAESSGWVYGARWELDQAANLMRCAETWCVDAPEVREFMAFSRQRTQAPGGSTGPIHQVWASNAPVWIPDVALESSVRRGPSALKAGLHSTFAFPILIGDEFYGVIEFYGREPRPREPELIQLVRIVGSQIGQFMARRAAEQNLRFVASHDPLTGLFNRSMFNERLQQTLAQAARFERTLALLFIDLDGFKLINDTFGHNSGDAPARHPARGRRDRAHGRGRVRGAGGGVHRSDPGGRGREEGARDRDAADGAARAGMQRDGEPRHQHLPRRRQGRAGAAQERRHRDVPGEAARQEQLPLLLAATERAPDGAPVDGGQPAARGGARRAAAAVPAQGRRAGREGERGGGAVAVAAPDAGRDQPLRIRAARGGRGTDRVHRGVGAAHGVPAGDRLARAGPAVAARCREPLAASVPAGEPDPPGTRGAAPNGGGARAARSRDHRGNGDSQPRARGAPAGAIQGAGRARRARRFRHRLLVPEPASAPADRQREDRSLADTRPAARPAVRSLRWRTASASRSRPRVSRRASNGNSCAMRGARKCRATTSAPRSRPTSWWASCGSRPRQAAAPAFKHCARGAATAPIPSDREGEAASRPGPLYRRREIGYTGPTTAPGSQPEEIAMKIVSQLLEAKGREIHSIAPDASVFDALKLMADRNVGALVVLDNGRLAGIFSERDYARKVILVGKSSHDIPVRDIMTAKVITVRPGQTVEECMALMTEKRIRHLPVTEGERLIGVLSIGDLVKEVIAEQEQTIKQLESYIHH